MKTSLLFTTLALILTAGVSAAQSSATYELRLVTNWSSATHPSAYPNGAHFSPLIGGTHSAAGEFWQAGGFATNGIIGVMAETGRPTALRDEILVAGDAGVVIQGPGITSPSGTMTSFTTTAAFPLVTVVTMVAPSSDELRQSLLRTRQRSSSASYRRDIHALAGCRSSRNS